MRIFTKFFLHLIVFLYILLIEGKIGGIAYIASMFFSAFLVLSFISDHFHSSHSKVLDDFPVFKWGMDFFELFLSINVAYLFQILALFFMKFLDIHIENFEDLEYVTGNSYDGMEQLKSQYSFLEALRTTPFNLYPSTFIILFYGVSILIHFFLLRMKEILEDLKKK